jgi:hypothetical protein
MAVISVTGVAVQTKPHTALIVGRNEANAQALQRFHEQAALATVMGAAFVVSPPA